MTDLSSLLLAAIEQKATKAEAAKSLTVLLNWPRQNGKATIRAFMDDNDPAAVLRRCAADRRIVERCVERRDGFALAQFVLDQLAFAYGLDIPAEGEAG